MTMPTMTLKKRIKNILKNRKVREQIGYPIGGEVDRDDWQYRVFSSQALDRRLTDIEQERLQRVSYWLWLTNPLAHRAVELMVDYVIGSGFTLTAQNEKVQEVLNLHWNHPRNAWDIRLRERLRDLIIFGELVIPAFVSDYQGIVLLGHLDPYLIKGVETDPDDISYPVIIHEKSISGRGERSWRIIHYNDDGDMEGDCFYFTLNKLSSMSRGFSPLLPVVDWFGAYDRLVFALAENQAAADEFIWDITIKDATQAEIERWLKAQDQSRGSGKWFVHNDRISRDAKFPDLRGQDRTAVSKLLLGMILAGVAQPVHWLTGMAEDVNRASSLSMGDPTMVSLTSLQTYYLSMIRLVLEYQLYCARVRSESLLRGVPDDEMTFQLSAPAINIENSAQESERFARESQTILIAEQQGWITRETAANIWRALAQERFKMEVEISPNIAKESALDAFK